MIISSAHRLWKLSLVATNLNVKIFLIKQFHHLGSDGADHGLGHVVAAEPVAALPVPALLLHVGGVHRVLHGLRLGLLHDADCCQSLDDGVLAPAVTSPVWL